MKNFRKVLALVLVVATLFSFTAMTSAAYEDASDISYNEAVTVLSAVGVLNGYEVAEDEYEFKPTQTISREEMAKMIAVLANAGTDVSTLYASACTFADVAKTRWSASYVAYCAKTGIVAGRSATTFDPTGKVTGLETAKMLLVVLGFDAEEQGYVGSDWKVNVLRDAKVMGLLNNFAASYDIEAAITREEAAQMMLNALEAPCVVGLVSKNVVTVTNALVSYTTKTAPNTVTVSTYAKLKDAITAGSWSLYGNVLISDDLLGATLFGLTRSTSSDRDCFGRPATSWKYTAVNGDVKTIGVYAASPIFESSNTSKSKMTAALKAYDGLEAVLYVDGVKKDPDKTKETVADVLTLAADYLGKGVQVEAFFNNNIITVVVINTYLGSVGHPNTAKGTVEIAGYNVVNTFGFKHADEGTTVLYWLCSKDGTKANQGIHTVEVAEPAVVTLHGNRSFAEYFCDSNEKNYEYAKNMDTDSKTTVKENLGNEVYVFTDKFGYVLFVSEVGTAPTTSLLVGKSGWKTATGNNNYGTYGVSYTAKFVEFGENPVVSDATAVDGMMYAKDSAGLTTNGQYDVLVKWNLNAKGERAYADVATKAEATGDNAFVLKQGKGTISNFTYAGDENTQYLLRLTDADTGKYVYKYFDGCGEIDGTYLLNELQYFMAYNGTDYSNRYVSYVYADASYAYNPSLAFVLSYATDESYWTGGSEVKYHLFDAIVNGEEAYIAYTYESVAAIDELREAVGTYDGIYFAVEASYVKVIADTHDDKPIYLAKSVGESKGKDFLISGNVLTYNGNALEMADNATIIVAYEFTQLATAQKWGTWGGVEPIENTNDLVGFLEDHGWDTAYGWYRTNGAGEVTDLYIYVNEKAPAEG